MSDGRFAGELSEVGEGMNDNNKNPQRHRQPCGEDQREGVEGWRRVKGVPGDGRLDFGC